MSEPDFRGNYPGSKRVLPALGLAETPPAERRSDESWDARPTKKWIKGKEVELFAIGALCKALGRPPVTVRLWIRQGHLPREPARMPTRNGIRGRRLYSREHIEAILTVFRDHGLLDAKRVDWSKHSTVAQEINEAWSRITIA